VCIWFFHQVPIHFNFLLFPTNQSWKKSWKKSWKDFCNHSVSLLQHIPNAEIRKITKINDALTHAKKLKWNFAGHIQRTTDNRWTKLIENWIPTDGFRNRGHQRKRWQDEIETIGLGRWRQKANDRKLWKKLGAPFVPKWTEL